MTTSMTTSGTTTVGVDTRRSWLIIAVLFGQWLIGYFDKTAMSVLAVPIGKEFGFSASQIGLVLSAFFLGFAAMTPVGGYLADRFGARRVLFTVMLLWSVFTGLTVFTWSLASLIVFRALFGLEEGSFPAASSAAVAQLLPVGQRGRAKALLTSGSTLGTAAGAFLTATLASGWGWRFPFIVFSVVGIVTSFLFLAVSGPMQAPGRRAAAAGGGVPFREVLRSPLVWVLAGTQFGVGFFAWGLSQWMPSYWMQAKGLNLASASVATALPNFVAFFAMVSMGFLSDRMAGREGRFISLAMAVTIAATSLTYYATTIAQGVLFIGIAQVAISCCAPLLAIVVLKRMDVRVAGTATGLTNFGQQFAGVVAPTAMGFAIDLAGGAYGVIFGMVVAILAVCALLSLTIDRISVGTLGAGQPGATTWPAPRPA